MKSGSTRVWCAFWVMCATCPVVVTGAQHGWGASSREVRTSADTVALRFGWLPGLEARIETTRVQEQTAGTTDTVTGSSSYSMRVHAHDAGLVITYDGFEFTAADTSGGAERGSLEEQAAAMVPKVVVDTAGGFVGVEGVAEVRARLDSLMTRMLGEAEAAAARETLSELVTDDALAGLAAQEWNAIVGRWAGADLAEGVRYEFTEEAALPLMPGAVVPMVSSFTLERRTACSEGGTGTDCVEIRLVSRADPEGVAAVLRAFTERLLATPGIGGLAFESFTMENEMLLITEPSTLRPHRVRMSKSMTGTVSAAGERSVVSQNEVRTYRYRYTH